MDDARAAARDELTRRAHIDWEDDAIFTIYDTDAIDEVRSMRIFG